MLGRGLAPIGLLIGLTACGSTSVGDYQAREPAFAREDFFSGALTAHGLVMVKAMGLAMVTTTAMATAAAKATARGELPITHVCDVT